MNKTPPPTQHPELLQQLTPIRLALAGLVVLITLVLALVLRDFVRNTIVLPLINFFWIVWLGMTSLPQAVWWFLLVIVGFIVALRSLKLPGVQWIHRGPGFGRSGSSSRYAYWKYGLESQGLSPFSRERIRRDLQGLVLRVLSAQLRVENEEVRERLLSGEFNLPQPVADLFVYTPPAPFEPARRWDGLTGWFRRPTQPAGMDVEPILAWLEAQTNVKEVGETELFTTEAQRHGENL